MLCVVCCVLCVVCCVLCVVCCLLFVVCCLLFVVCCLLFVVCCLLFVVCCFTASRTHVTQSEVQRTQRPDKDITDSIKFSKTRPTISWCWQWISFIFEGTTVNENADIRSGSVSVFAVKRRPEAKLGTETFEDDTEEHREHSCSHPLGLGIDDLLQPRSVHGPVITFGPLEVAD